MHKLLNNKKGKKSQLWYTDLIIAVTLFTIMMLLAFKYISNNYVFEKSDLDKVMEDSDKISGSLMGLGLPSNWSEEEYGLPGILDEGWSLNQTKLMMFNNLTNNNYDELRMKLGISSDFILYFMDNRGNLLNLSYDIFMGSGHNMSQVDDMFPQEKVSTTRYLVYKEGGYSSIIGMKVVVWQG